MSSTHPTMQRLFEATKMQPSELAAALNTSPQNITNWSARGISKNGAMQASKLLGVDANYILTGEENTPSPVIRRESNVRETGRFRTWSRSDPLPDDEFAYIPYAKDIRFQGGTGNLEMEDYNGYMLPFARSTLHRYGINPARAVCVTLHGDSMEPVMPSGSTIGINLDDTAISDGGTYAFRHDDLLRVKRLYRMPGGMVRINSYNQDDPAYKDEIVPLDEIVVIGRIFTWSVMV